MEEELKPCPFCGGKAIFTHLNRPFELIIEERNKISRSNEKAGLKLALDIISTEQRYNMCYEWMEETKNGEYIKIESIRRKIIEELKKEENK